MPLPVPPSRPTNAAGNRARGRRHCPRPQRVVRRAAWRARVRAALSVAGLVGMVASVAVGGFWYVTVRLPTAAVAAEAERLAAESLLPPADAVNVGGSGQRVVRRD